MSILEIDDLTGEIVDAAVKVHMRVGPGLLESVYQVLLANELERRKLAVEQEKVVAIEVDGIRFEKAFCVDLLVNGLVVIELKSVEKLAPVHFSQVSTYLRLLDLRVGFLMNFGETTLKDGLHRIVNRFEPSASSRLRVNQR